MHLTESSRQPDSFRPHRPLGPGESLFFKIYFRVLKKHTLGLFQGISGNENKRPEAGLSRAQLCFTSQVKISVTLPCGNMSDFGFLTLIAD